jgi:Zn ribbon nucleic-acid-binding protein
MLGKFRLWHLDDGSFIVCCGNCGYHLVITKELQDRVRQETVLGVVEEEKINV